MSNAKHIGRVGALAVALGVGIAVANAPGVASAEPTDSGASLSADSSRSTDRGRHQRPPSAPGQVAVSSSGGARTWSRAASAPTSAAPSGTPVRRARLGAPADVGPSGGPHDSSPTGLAASPALTASGTKPASISSTPPVSTTAPRETPSDDTPHTVGADSSRRWGTTAVIGRRQPNTAAAGFGSPLAKTTSALAAATAPADTTPPALSTPPVLPSGTAAAPTVMSFTAGAAATAQDAPTFAVTAPTPTDPVSSMVSTLVRAVAYPFANNAPTTPVGPSALLSLLAFARRESERAFSDQSPTDNPLADQVTNGLVTDTARLTAGTEPTADVSMVTSLAAPTTTKAPATFTGEPSFVSQAFSAVFSVVGAVGNFLGVDLTIPLVQLLSSDSPPWFTTLGLNVQRSEFEGMPVWALQSPGSSSEETVVAPHGGAFVAQPTIFHWLAYAAMASDTGATVLVPIYPLVPQGTAGTVVPAMADLISSQIDQHGAENVSVFGDSAGGGIALAAVQELVRRGDPVPSRMVLSSPGLDLTLSNPAIPLVDDPVFPAVAVPNLDKYAQLWADGLDLTDPLVSPLYGSLAGLPPTAVYAGSRDIVAPDVLVLQDNALATPGADFTFILRKGEPHDWAAVTILPETQAVLPDIYQQLGIAD